jgi:hypothetical protein
MPEMNGEDTFAYFVVNRARVTEVQSFRSRLLDLAAMNEGYERVNAYANNKIASTKAMLESMSSTSVEHPLTFVPQGYASLDYDDAVGPYFDVVADGGTQLVEFPTCIVTIMEPPQARRLFASMRALLALRMFESQHEKLAIVLARLEGVDLAKHTIVAWYEQWS